jgi:FkbM family methyltransferase
MVNKFSLSLGNFLFKNAYPIYNIVYPIFKRKQDKLEIDFLTKTIKPGMVVLDIGANIGFYTEIVSKLVGSTGKIHAFEPDSLNFQRLQKKLLGCSNVNLVQKAVSINSENLKIYTSKVLNVDHRTYEVEDYDEVIEIPAVSIDEYLGENQHVDFIKMDIQGAEYFALKGMKSTILSNPNVIILMEFWPFGLGLAKSSARALLGLIQEYGLKMFLFTEDGMTPLNTENIHLYENKPYEYYENIILKK